MIYGVAAYVQRSKWIAHKVQFYLATDGREHGSSVVLESRVLPDNPSQHA